jgi:dipeptidyl aminopeptidase/acylaminoacyl peptidase
MAGVDQLVADGRADPDALGLGGLSFGGYAAALLISRTPRFKAAVVGAGWANNPSYVNTTDMPEFGAQLAPHDALWESSPIRHAADIVTPTLVLHGELDLRIPASNGIELFNVLRRHGVDAAMRIYPREGHVFGAEAAQRDALETVLAWFRRHLLAR